MSIQASRTRPTLGATRNFVLQIILALLLAVAVIATAVPRLMRALPPETLEGMTLDISAVP